MISKEYVETIVLKYKNKARECIKKRKYNLALEMISNSAKLLYESNIEYKDDELEEMIKDISFSLN